MVCYRCTRCKQRRCQRREVYVQEKSLTHLIQTWIQWRGYEPKYHGQTSSVHFSWECCTFTLMCTHFTIFLFFFSFSILPGSLAGICGCLEVLKVLKGARDAKHTKCMWHNECQKEVKSLMHNSLIGLCFGMGWKTTRRIEHNWG